MKTIKHLLSGILIVSSTMAFAQNAKEMAQNKNQIKVDKNQLTRDTQEVELFKEQTIAYLSSNKNKQVLIASMEREIKQTEAKLARATVEVVQSTKEVATDRREKRRNRRLCIYRSK